MESRGFFTSARNTYDPYNNRRKRLESSEIAKKFFEEFKDSNFMDDFKLLIADSTGWPKSYAFHFVIKKLLQKKNLKEKHRNHQLIL